MISLDLREGPNFIRPEILLHPTIPPSLFGVNPRSIRGKAWWDKVRALVYEENNYCCWACGVPKVDAQYNQWLECHECYEYDLDTNIATFTEVVALCHACHAFIHKGRLVQTELKSKVVDVLVHGAKVLWEANLPCPAFVVKTLRRYDPQLKFAYVKEQPMIESHPHWLDLWALKYEGQLYTFGGKVDGNRYPYFRS